MTRARFAALIFAATLAGCAATQSGVGLPQTGTQALGQAANATTQAGALATGAGTMATTAGSAVKNASLTDLLVSRLGVTNQQAMGGAGAIFELAKQNMSVTDFGQVSAAVPGMSGMLAAAPALSAATGGGGGGLLGTAAGMMGGQGGSLASMASLGGAFQGLGMNADMASQFLPIVLQYVQSQGGLSTMSLLKAALF